MKEKLEERWQNVYKGDVDLVGNPKWDSKKAADRSARKEDDRDYDGKPFIRTHYVKSYWNKEDVLVDIELIKIEKD